MKKILVLIVFTLLIFAFNCNYNCYADSLSTIDSVPSNTSDIIKQYLRSADSYSKNIELIAKNAISIDPCNKSNLSDYIKNIDFITSQINTTKNYILTDQQIYKKDTELNNMLLALNSVFANYKYALNQLKVALQTDDPDINYKSLSTFFSVMNYTDQHLSILTRDFIKFIK